MKKKLEADLISIAHRILQLKNKSDIDQLYLETQKLYEKLTVLRFVENYFGEPKPTIGQAEVVEKMAAFFETIEVSEFQRPPAIIEETPVVEIIEDKGINPIEVKEVEKIEQEEATATTQEVPALDTAEAVEETKESEEVIAEKTEEETPIFS